MRKLLGYVRYDSAAALVAINALSAELRLLQNLFLPSVKLVEKRRVGARLQRRYDAPCTLRERVVACPAADREKVRALEQLRARLDPFLLAQRVDQGSAPSTDWPISGSARRCRQNIRVSTLPALWTPRTRPQGRWKTA